MALLLFVMLFIGHTVIISSQVLAITVDNFYPYGNAAADASLPSGDDELKSHNLTTAFPFFGSQQTTYHVSKNAMSNRP